MMNKNKYTLTTTNKKSQSEGFKNAFEWPFQTNYDPYVLT